MPRVSVIIPTVDRPEFLRAALRYLALSVAGPRSFSILRGLRGRLRGIDPVDP